MNVINFNIEDIEKIDLSMDVGVKKIYPPIENLEVTPTKEQQVFTHENSYGYDKVTVEPMPEIKLQDKEVTPTKETQNITSNEGYDGLNKVIVNPIPNGYIEPSGTLQITENGAYDVKKYEQATVEVEGSSGGGVIQQPYLLAKHITETINTTVSINMSTYRSLSGIFNMVLVIAFVRSDYTMSDQVTVLYEKETETDPNGNVTQKLIVGYTYNLNADIKVTQASNARIGLGVLFFGNCGVPEVIDDVDGAIYPGEMKITTDEYLNLYALTQLYNTNPKVQNFSEYYRMERLHWYLSNYASDNKILSYGNSKIFNQVIHLRIPFEKQ